MQTAAADDRVAWASDSLSAAMGTVYLLTVVYWGYMRVYAVRQPPYFLTAYTHLSDHK